jgi:hypothetical protein
MRPDLQLAQACLDTYETAAHWDQSWTREGVYVGLQHGPDFDIIAFRGSTSEQDWIRDFMGWPSRHEAIGYCHSGFLEGMDTVADEIAQAITASKRPFALTGHSLGAARALILGGLLITAGIIPDLAVTFGTPRPGMAKLSHILNGAGFPIRHYRNGPDPVTEVPLTLPPLWLYQKPQPDTPLVVAPPEVEDAFHWHHMPLYYEGVKGFGLGPAEAPG